MHKSIKLLIVIVVAFGLTAFLFPPRGANPIIWAGIATAVLPIWLVHGFSSIAGFVERNGRVVLAAGIALAAIAVFGAIGIFESSRTAPDSPFAEHLGNAAVVLACFGVALTVLPQSVPAMRRAEVAQAAKKAAKEAGAPGVEDRTGFSPIREGRQAIAFVCRNAAALLRIAGPWAFIIWSAPLCVAYSTALPRYFATGILTSPWGHLDGPAIMAVIFLPLVLALIGGATALTAWHRFIAGEGFPRFWLALPEGRALRYLWRLWLVMTVLGVIDSMAVENAPRLAKFVGISPAGTPSDLIFWCVPLVFVFLSAPMALVLPAVALGRKDFRGSDSVLVARPLGARFSIGFLLSVLPFELALGLTAYGAQHWSSLPLELLTGLYVVFLFLASASGATYLTRAYLMLTNRAP